MKNASEEQSSKQEQALIDSMMKKIDGSEPCDKNQATLGIKLSFKNHVTVAADIFKANEQAVEDKSYNSIQKDVSERSLVASKKSENSYRDNNNNIESNVLVKLRKSSQNDNLDKLQPTRKNSDPTSVCGLLINIFVFIILLFKITTTSKI